MKPGRKRVPSAEKVARGTNQPCRRLPSVSVVSPSDLPQQPDWLTEGGQAQWLDNIGRVSGLAGEADSVMFGTFCNLAAACGAAWGACDVPPAAHLAELRRLAELFGLTGPSSRPVKDKPLTGNAFTRRRPD